MPITGQTEGGRAGVMSGATPVGGMGRPRGALNVVVVGDGGAFGSVPTRQGNRPRGASG